MSTATMTLGDGSPVLSTNPVPIIPESGLLTDDGGPNRRLRVDVGQTGFFAGREFRTFHEFTISNTNVLVLKFTCSVNFILSGLDFTLITGEVKATINSGGTEGGAFSETLPIIARNTMTERPTPYYTTNASLVAGGTHTGGTQLDLLWAKVTDNSNKASSSDTEMGAERGFAAGTYYLKLTALADSTGVFHARWEERP